MRYLSMYKRIFEPLEVRKSYFFLGPRQTGKSTLLKDAIEESNYIDLLNPSLFLEVSARPETLVEIVRQVMGASKDKYEVFVIDEVQKNPRLLDTVQYLLGMYPKVQFILSGSSARKLKKEGQNLLGGRASKVYLYPLTLKELSQVEKNPLSQALKYGGLPGVRTSKAPEKELLDYIGVYLNDEIMAEAYVRNISGFSRFLSVAGLCNAEQINYEKIGSDAHVAGRTVKEYFDLLEDTMIGTRLEPYRPQKNRKFVTAPKFYIFDVGVAHFLNKKSVQSLSDIELGKSFEQLMFNELKAFISYTTSVAELFFWRTHTGHEVDFVIKNEKNEIIAIEVKYTKKIDDRDLRGLRAFSTEVEVKRKIVVCNVERARQTEDNCEILPIMKFVEYLWNGNVF